MVLWVNIYESHPRVRFLFRNLIYFILMKHDQHINGTLAVAVEKFHVFVSFLSNTVFLL